MSSGKKLGTLVVVVLKARHLKDSHTFYKQDPYALIRIGGTEKKTNIDPKGGQHPVWDEEFHFSVRETAPGSEGRTMSVEVYSKEHKVDDLIGEGRVDISDTLLNGEFDDWVKLEMNGAYRGEIYLEMTFYSAAPPLVRRPSKILPQDRLLPPPPTPPKETTSPYISPQRSPQLRPRTNSSNSSYLQPSSSPHLYPSSPHLHPSSPRPQPSVSSTSPSPRHEQAALPTILPLSTPPRQTQVDPALKNIPFLDVGPPTYTPTLIPAPAPTLYPLHIQSSSSPHLHPSSPRLHPPVSSTSSSLRPDQAPLPTVPTLSKPPPQPCVDPTLKNIPFLDVGPSAYTSAPTASLAPSPAPTLHSVPSILRPRNVKSSPIPIYTQDDMPPPPPPKNDLDESTRRFQRELAESDAAFAAQLAEHEGIDVERLKAEEADSELARRLAYEERGSEKDGASLPGGWVG